MKQKGFTLIELLAVIVILAIIALIATPIILNIIDDAKEESGERSVEMYASAVKNAAVKYQLNGKKLAPGVYTSSEDGKTLSKDGVPSLTIEYDGTKVVCTTIEIYEDGNIYLAGCNGNYTYGSLQMPTSVSFAEDSWETIAANVKAGNTSKYNVGDTKTITLTGDVAGTYTVRIANTTTEECKNLASQSACGFVIEFVDIITKHGMNDYDTSYGGWPESEMYKFLNDTTDSTITSIYESLPEDLQKVIADTPVVSGGQFTNYPSTDKLYLLSTKEISGSASMYDGVVVETRQLDYYENNFAGAIKKYDGSPDMWWLRSDGLNSPIDTFYSVDDKGSCGGTIAPSSNIGVSPAFRIG